MRPATKIGGFLQENHVDVGSKNLRFGAAGLRSAPNLARKCGKDGAAGVDIGQERAQRRMLARRGDSLDALRIGMQVEAIGPRHRSIRPRIGRHDDVHNPSLYRKGIAGRQQLSCAVVALAVKCSVLAASEMSPSDADDPNSAASEVPLLNTA